MHTPMTSALDVVGAVCASPCPVIFLDTAAILDVLRVPFRHELQVDILDAAAALIDDSAAAPRRVWAISTWNVMQELQANRQAVLQELRTSISNLRKSTNRLSRVASLVLPERQLPPVDWSDDELGDRVLRIMDRMADSLTLFRGSVECVGRARDRLWAGLPPASESRREYKDCEIFEEFLELAHALRASRFGNRIVFVTSNTKDYGKPPAGHAQIGSDVIAAGALFVGNVAWARSIIRESPQSNTT
jgi:hypothetical protein